MTDPRVPAPHRPQPDLEPSFGCALLAGLLIAAVIFLPIGLAVGYAYGSSAPRPAAIPTSSPAPADVSPGPGAASGSRPTGAPTNASPSLWTGSSPKPDAAGTSHVQPTAKPSAAPTGAIGTAALAGTAAWYDDGPGLYAALPSFRWGDRPYEALVRGPAGMTAVTVRDHQARRDRLVDLSPAAFVAVCGPLGRGTCTVELELP